MDSFFHSLIITFGVTKLKLFSLVPLIMKTRDKKGSKFPRDHPGEEGMSYES